MAETEQSNTTSNGSGDGPSDLDKKVIRQIEYYFGDINLARDRFMQTEIKKEDGWIPLETLIKFNRLKQLTEDFDVIVKALRKSESGLVEISDDEKKIRRVQDKPLPEHNKDFFKGLNERTTYTKGFPLDITLDQLMDFFEQQGQVENIQMRRDAQKAFKGSVFTLFKTVEDAKKFVETESVKYEDTELIKMLKNDYFEKKNEERKERKAEEAKKKEELKQERLKNQEKEEQEKIETRMTKGAILHLTGFSGDTCTREDIKAAFADHGKVAWVDFEKGQEEAWLRFDEEGGAGKAWASIQEKSEEGKVKICDFEMKGDVLEGDAEIAHWRDIFSQKDKKRNTNKRQGKKPFKRGGRNNDGPSAKKARSDD